VLFRGTKNGDDRYVDVTPQVIELLRGFEHARDGRVFGWTSTPIVNRAIATEAERLGMPAYSTHQIGRHAFAERMLNDGHTLYDVAEGGGWKSMEVLRKAYGPLERKRVADAMKDKAAELMRKTIRVVK